MLVVKILLQIILRIQHSFVLRFNMEIIKQFEYTPRKFYVYIHRRVTDNRVFYVGKGRSSRGWKASGRNNLWHKVANKHGVVCEIVKDNLDEELSFTLEKDLISFYGRLDLRTGHLVNFTDGGEGKSGSVVSEESIAKQQESAKNSKACKEYYKSMSRKVIMDESICFNSGHDCAKFVAELHNKEMQSNHINRVANLKSYSYLGHVFRWIDSNKDEFYRLQSEIKHLKKQEKIKKMKACPYESRKRKIQRSDGVVFSSVLEASKFFVSNNKAKNLKSAKSTLNAALRGETVTAFGYQWVVIDKPTILSSSAAASDTSSMNMDNTA